MLCRLFALLLPTSDLHPLTFAFSPSPSHFNIDPITQHLEHQARTTMNRASRRLIWKVSKFGAENHICLRCRHYQASADLYARYRDPAEPDRVPKISMTF
jgi:hypothetical protein